MPSQTELLFDLGLEKEIAGITKFCIHPFHKCKQVTKVGGTKNFRFDVIDRLQPDLIIGNKEENYKEGIERLQEQYPVWISDIYTLPDALGMMEGVGCLTGKEREASALINSIEEAFKSVEATYSKRVAYFIWREPYMVAGSHTFIHDMLTRCGFVNAFAHLERYPEITHSQLTEAKPDLIFLSSEPYPFKEKHTAEFKTYCPQAQILVVDGEMFSWYGSRLLQAPAYFNSLIQKL